MPHVKGVEISYLCATGVCFSAFLIYHNDMVCVLMGRGVARMNCETEYHMLLLQVGTEMT